MISSDAFYHYRSVIGDLTESMHRHAVPGLQPTQGFITNAFGVKVNPKHLPEVLRHRDGVEPLPIPANWHADIAEFGAAFRAVDLAKDQFTIVELGCGWGCWLNIAGAVARNKGLKVKLIGVEGDAGHVAFAKESLTENGFAASEFEIHHAIAGSSNGCALFPIQEQSGVMWGLEAVFNPTDTDKQSLLASGKYAELEVINLARVLPNAEQRIDLIHIDIQGAEIPLIPDLMPFLNERAAMMLIGTHSRPIEGQLFDCLLAHQWVLEVERPAILELGVKPQTLVDGVQLWRNPRLLPDAAVLRVDTRGTASVLMAPASAPANGVLQLDVRLENQSDSDWPSQQTPCPVNLSYHWLTESGEMVEFDGLRTPLLGGSLSKQSAAEQRLTAKAPSSPGTYQLTVTVVQEGIQWFDAPTFAAPSVLIRIV